MYMNPSKYRIGPDVRKPIFLDNYLTYHMDLNHFTQIDGHTPYTRSLFNKWWYRYFYVHHLSIDGVHYNVDNFICSLTGISPGSIIILEQLWHALSSHITLYAEIDEQVSVQFCREEYDLIITPRMVLMNLYI